MNKLKISAIVVLIIVLACSGYFYKNYFAKVSKFTDSVTGLSFLYPRDWGSVNKYESKIVDKDLNREGYIVKKGYKISDFDGTILTKGNVVAINFEKNKSVESYTLPSVYIQVYSSDFQEASGAEEIIPFYSKKNFDSKKIENLNQENLKDVACPKYDNNILNELSCKQELIDGKPAYTQYIMRCGPQSPDCYLYGRTYILNKNSKFPLIQVGFNSSYGELNNLIDDSIVEKNKGKNDYEIRLLSKVREELINSNSKIGNDVGKYEQFVDTIRIK